MVDVVVMTPSFIIITFVRFCGTAIVFTHSHNRISLLNHHLQPPQQWLFQPPRHNTFVGVTTNNNTTTTTSTVNDDDVNDDDGYVANGIGHRIVGILEQSEDGWMSSPSKHRKLQQHMNCKNGHSSIHFCGGNNNNKKKRIGVSRSTTFSFLFMLLLLLISFMIGYRNNYTYLLYQQQQVLSSPQSSFNNHHVSTPLLHEQQQLQQQRLPRKEIEPRLRKQWYQNPFRNSQSNHDTSNLQPPKQPKVVETPFRFWNQLWIRHRQTHQQQMKDQQQQNQNIFQNTNHIITLQDLTDLKNQYHHHSDIIPSTIHSPPPIKHMTTMTTN